VFSIDSIPAQLVAREDLDQLFSDGDQSLYALLHRVRA